MNKADFAKKFAEKTNLELSEAQKSELVDAFNETLKEILVAGEEISFVGFGSWKTGERAAREGRNPKTGETIQIPASKVVSFKAGKGLKEALNA